MAKTKGLGRGLDSLLATDMEESVANNETLTTLPVTALQSGKYQPRSLMDESALQTLAESIATQGVMQPILVRAVGEDQYEIIAGERRWRASQKAGLDEVPVIIREIPDESALAMALIENIQRENLNPLEEAQGIKRLIDEFDMTHEKAAHAVGRSRVAVSNLLRLLTLCAPVQEMLMSGQIEMGHARTLVGQEGAHQVILAERIVKDELSVREAEKMVRAFDVDTELDQSTPSEYIEDQDVKRLEESLSEKLGAVVNIKSNKSGKGTVKINYGSLDQLDGIIAKITN